MASYPVLVQGIGRYLEETATTQPVVDAETDNKFSETIGRKEDAAASGAVGTTKSIAAMIKQAVTLLLGTAIGAPLHTVAAGIQSTLSGTTIVTATGSVFIKAVHLKKLTTSESGVTSFRLLTDDTVALAMLLYKPDGALVTAADFPGGASFVFDVGWVLSTTKALKLLSGGSNGQAAGYQVIVEAYALSEGASLA